MNQASGGIPWLWWGEPPIARTVTTTRFAPAPTGRLHLGHLANIIFVWGLARRAGGMVLLRIEDHDRQRSRTVYESALLRDLDRLGIEADEPSTESLRLGSSTYRQSDNQRVYDAAMLHLGNVADLYPCDCTRATFATWRSTHDASWTGPGCPGDCRRRQVAWHPNLGMRVALGDGEESWVDQMRGESSGPVAPAGDALVRDRNGNRTYMMCVVVDDIRHGVDLVVRGEDLLDATPAQIRLGRLLGRATPPTFAHHPLVRRADGSKLSKADGATAVGELLDTGKTPADLFGEAAWNVGLAAGPAPLTFEEAIALVSR